MASFRALIIDDEPLARRRLRLMLDRHPEVVAVAECSNGREAMVLAEQKPNLLFVDIQMPELGGFEMLAALELKPAPAIIFVTAHQEFALQAFGAEAVDYLVKPFTRERFGRAMDRAARFLRGGARAEVAQRGGVRRRDRFAIRLRDQVLFVKAAELNWIGAEGNYARLHTSERSYLIRESMQKLEEELDPALFVRVHRSAIVNIERVSRLVARADGAFSVILHGEQPIPLGPSYRDRLESFLGQKL